MDKNPTLARRLANALDDEISRLRRLLDAKEKIEIAEALGQKAPSPAPEQRGRSADDLARDAKDMPPTKHDHVPPDVPKQGPTIIVPGMGQGGGPAGVVHRATPPPILDAPTAAQKPDHRPAITLARSQEAPAEEGWRPLARLAGELEPDRSPPLRERTIVEKFIELMRPEDQRHALEKLHAERAAERVERIKDGLQQRSDVVEILNKRLAQKL